MSRMTSDIENLQQLLQDGLAQFAIQGLTMIVITAILFTLDVRLAFITVVLIVPALVAMSLWFRRDRPSEATTGCRDGIANVLADLSESLHGVRVVTAHNRQQRNVVHHRNVVGRYRDANNYTAQINAVYGPSTQLLGVLGQAVLLGVGGDMVLSGSLSLGALVAFFLYLNRFLQPIQLLVQQYNTYQQGQASIFKLRTLLETEPSVRESPTATELPPVSGEIVFEDVSFGYEPSVPVLTGVNLRIAAGETVAFVGSDGSGQIDDCEVDRPFLRPDGGRVLIDGHDLRSVTMSSLRRQLGVVPQEPFLFAGTIRDNIAFARPDASAAEVDEAVRAVGLVELIESLPEGLDTVVQERGQSLSSGERQLLALARAFLAHPQGARARRGDLEPRPAVRDEDRGGARHPPRGPHCRAHCPPPLDGHEGRPDRRRRGRPDRRGGPAHQLVEAGGRYAEMYATWVSQSSGEEEASEERLGLD